MPSPGRPTPTSSGSSDKDPSRGPTRQCQLPIITSPPAVGGPAGKRLLHPEAFLSWKPGSPAPVLRFRTSPRSALRAPTAPPAVASRPGPAEDPALSLRTHLSSHWPVSFPPLDPALSGSKRLNWYRQSAAGSAAASAFSSPPYYGSQGATQAPGNRRHRPDSTSPYPHFRWLLPGPLKRLAFRKLQSPRCIELWPRNGSRRTYRKRECTLGNVLFTLG